MIQNFTPVNKKSAESSQPGPKAVTIIMLRQLARCYMMVTPRPSQPTLAGVFAN